MARDDATRGRAPQRQVRDARQQAGGARGVQARSAQVRSRGTQAPPRGGAQRQAHGRPRRKELPLRNQVLLVGLGGCLGTLLRYLVSIIWPTPLGGFPYATIAVNCIGAFALGLLIAYTQRAGRNVGAHNSMRLFLGTGLCGGFTTYSAYVLESETLISMGLARTGLLYLGLTLVCGLLLTFAGIAVARLVTRGGGNR